MDKHISNLKLNKQQQQRRTWLKTAVWTSPVVAAISLPQHAQATVPLATTSEGPIMMSQLLSIRAQAAADCTENSNTVVNCTADKSFTLYDYKLPFPLVVTGITLDDPSRWQLLINTSLPATIIDSSNLQLSLRLITPTVWPEQPDTTGQGMTLTFSDGSMHRLTGTTTTRFCNELGVCASTPT